MSDHDDDQSHSPDDILIERVQNGWVVTHFRLSDCHEDDEGNTVQALHPQVYVFGDHVDLISFVAGRTKPPTGAAD